jgi:glycosyltransferase involved in cell wall biosynthesis
MPPILPELALVVPRRPLSICLVSVHGDPLAPVGSEGAGGQNVYVRSVARALAARGHQVDVFTRGRDCSLPEVHELDGARVIRLMAGGNGYVPREELFGHLPEFARGAMRWARRENRTYDAVHTNYWLSGWVGLRLTEAWQVPHFHTHHSLGAVKQLASNGSARVSRPRLEVEDALGRRATRIVATSPQEVESIGRHYPSRAATAIVPCGVGSEFQPRDRHACRVELGLPTNRPIVAYVGRFDPAKGIDTLIRALALIEPQHQPHLLLAGGFDPDAPDAREFQGIQALVNSLGLEERTTFLGRLDHTQLPSAYAAADIVVVPSHYESFGLVAVEAMACGTPVIASDVGGLRYTVIHRETGLLAPARDHLAFARAIGCLLDEPALRDRMGAAGARLVDRLFRWDLVAEQLEGLYVDAPRPGRLPVLA